MHQRDEGRDDPVEARPGYAIVVNFAYIEDRHITIGRAYVKDGKVIGERFRRAAR